MTDTTVTPYTFDILPELVGSPQKDSIAYWYAWGRLDQGHPAVAIHTADSPTRPSPTGSAWLFGRLYAASEAAWETGETFWAPGVITSWENFVATGGRSIRHRTYAAWLADQPEVPNGSAVTEEVATDA